MTLDRDRAEAKRRVREACSLIESAFRLSPDVPPQEVLDAVRSAMRGGAAMLADDVAEAVDRAR